MAAMQDFRNPYLNNEANNQLLAASSVGDLVQVRELIEQQGAQAMYRGEGGSSPIHLAAGENHLALVAYLIEELKVPVDYGDSHGASALHYACSMKCLETINYLLSRSANVNAVDDSGETPLHDACSRGETHGAALTVVQRLLQVDGIKIDHVSNARMRPLDVALERERNDLAQLFIHHGENPSEYLHVAAKNGSLGAVRYLLHCGADCMYEGDYGCTALDFACGIKENSLRLPMVQLLLEAGTNPTQLNRRRWTPFHTVCKEGRDLEVLRLMIEFGADTNCVAKEGATPLHIICGLGSNNGDNTIQDRAIMIDLLLTHGADINARDERGRTPLHRACHNNSCATVRVLLRNEYGADINAVDSKGKAPFLMARKANRWDLMEVFLESGRLGPEVIGPDRYGRTLLHHACFKGRIPAVKWLLKCYNADLHARTNSGLTPIEVAAVYKRRDVVFYLLTERNNQIIPHH